MIIMLYVSCTNSTITLQSFPLHALFRELLHGNLPSENWRHNKFVSKRESIIEDTNVFST